MKAREGVMSNAEFGDDLAKLYPVVEKDMSDSGSFDNVLEFLVMVGNRKEKCKTFFAPRMTPLQILATF